MRTKPELGIDTTRLRVNRVLNLSGKTGRVAGNALGCLGLFYASTESGLDYLNDGRMPDLCASLGAGALPDLAQPSQHAWTLLSIYLWTDFHLYESGCRITGCVYCRVHCIYCEQCKISAGY